MFTTLPSLPAVSTPPAAPPPSSAAPVDHSEASRAFARQLQEAQRQDKHGDAAPKQDRATQQAASPKAPSSTHRTPSEVAEATPRKTSGKPEAPADGGTDASASGDTSIATTGQDAAASEAGPQDLSALLAHLRGHSAEATDTTHARGAGRAAAGDFGGETSAQAGKAGQAGVAGIGSKADNGPGPVGAAGLDASGARTDALAAATAGASPAVQGKDTRGLFQEQLAAAQVHVQEQATNPDDNAKQLPDASTFSAALASAASAAAAVPASPAHGSPASPVQAQLPATPGSAEFAPQLGTKITTFVRDGVQHAQLHLNPAEMGPVTVQIQLDGQGARVHLMADQALTRQALEQAMPDLAGSLREAGLTLTGGGVFQQPRQASSDAGGQDKPGAGGRAGRGGLAGVGGRGSSVALDTGADSPARGADKLRRRGVVDLIA